MNRQNKSLKRPEQLSRPVGYITVIMSAILFGAAPLFATFIYAYDISGTELAFLRVAVAVPAVGIFNLARGEGFKIAWDKVLKIAIMALTGSVLTTVLLFESYSYIDTSVATTLHFSYPIVVLALSMLFYKEKTGVKTFLSFALCTVGILLFCNPVGGFTWCGFGLAIGSGFAYAFYVLYMDKSRILESISFGRFTFWFFTFSTILMLPVMLFMGLLPIRISTEGLILASAFSIGDGLTGTILLQIGIRRIGSRSASLISAVEPVTSVIAGYLFLNELLSIRSVLGVLFVLAATTYLIISRSKEHPEGGKQYMNFFSH